MDMELEDVVTDAFCGNAAGVCWLGLDGWPRGGSGAGVAAGAG